MAGSARKRTTSLDYKEENEADAPADILRSGTSLDSSSQVLHQAFEGGSSFGSSVDAGFISEKTQPTTLKGLEQDMLTRASVGLLKKRLELKKREDGSFTIFPIDDELSFDKGYFMSVRAVQLLRKRMPQDRTLIIGIAGASGAGKTCLAGKVHSVIPGSLRIAMDNYIDSSKLIDDNFDDYRLTDFDLLAQNLHDLQHGKSVDLPIYDFKSSSRIGYKRVPAPKSKVVILEGIYALHEKIRNYLDISVSISGGVHFDLIKRIIRDIERAGQTPSDCLQQITETVYPMYKAYIEPDLKKAQIRIINNFNPFMGLMNPTYILKSTKVVPVEEVMEVLDLENLKRKSREYYDIYLYPPESDPEDCSDWLRLRQCDGKYRLTFNEWITEGDMIICPHIDFEVSVKVLSGLLALGYEIGAILKRKSEYYEDGELTISVDTMEQLNGTFIQIKGDSRAQVSQTGAKLGLDGHYDPRPYVELFHLKEMYDEIDSGADGDKEFKAMKEKFRSMGREAKAKGKGLKMRRRGARESFDSEGPHSPGRSAGHHLNKENDRLMETVNDLRVQLEEEKLHRRRLEDRLAVLENIQTGQAVLQQKIDDIARILMTKLGGRR
eukprot:CAMPEP_0113903856 /NCGR_PEP_ID=MMETSP0780_2-20120614/22833_1 /TAXON_ID=652834 /ORGANISM="Palpitomonas bilix" /LENGTH=607 /DNA_ID=CAMNT_0000897209 /DNA_START=13 /DNA_END=1836 /DNA_ORIENTATION=- /assembly_acc=CAM_ASM_000599